MPPNWLIALALTLIATWRIKRVLRYRYDSDLFVKEIAGNNWIDKSRLEVAIRYYIYMEAFFFISLPIFVVISYVELFREYLWHIAIFILLSHGMGLFWWDRKFSVRKPKS